MMRSSLAFDDLCALAARFRHQLAAGDDFDSMSLSEKRLFNALASEWVGTSDELVECVHVVKIDRPPFRMD